MGGCSRYWYCSSYYAFFFFVQVLNELLIDRGSAQSLSNLDVYCNDRLITSVQGDGMLQAVYLKTNF